MRSLIVGLIFASAIFPTQAYAAPDERGPVTEARAREVLTLALKNIQFGMCSNGKLCAPATIDELNYPPVSIQDTRQAMTIGLLSGVAEKCGLDWNKVFFAPLMRHFRHQVRMSDRQLALIAFIHGTQQSAAFRSTPDDMCTDEMKARLSNSVVR